MSTHELERIEQTPTLGISLVSGPDPELAIDYARRAAKAIQSVLREGSGYVTITGQKRLTIEGWQMLAAATNHSIEVEWSRPMEDPEGAWEARAIVRDADGHVVAAGESMAAPDEKGGGRWSKGDAYAIRSMAQTRAMVRAASSRLRFIPMLSGFSGTPAEEMPRESPTPVKAAKPMNPYDEVVAAGRAEGLSTSSVRAALKAAGIKRPKDLEDEALFQVGMDAVLGIVGAPEPGTLPVAPAADDEALQGEIIEAVLEDSGREVVKTMEAEDAKAADAAWKASEPSP